jgi:ribosome maturation factor RimP
VSSPSSRVGHEATRDRVEAVLSRPLTELGLDLEAVEVQAAGSRRMLRVAVDKDGGVTMDDIADATRAVSAVLDESSAMGERAYTLEVTSRGVDRPLTSPRHWRRNAGRLVKVTLADGSVVTGRIGACDVAGVALDVSGEDRGIGYAEVVRALVQVEFNRRPEEGS